MRGVTKVPAGSPILPRRRRKSLAKMRTVIHSLRPTITLSATMPSNRENKRKRAHPASPVKPEEKVEVPFPPKKRQKERSVQEKRSQLRKEGERLARRAREKTTISQEPSD